MTRLAAAARMRHNHAQHSDQVADLIQNWLIGKGLAD